MFSFLEMLVNPQTLVSLLTAIAVGASIITISLPLLERNEIKSRMKSVATERETIRQRERSKLAASRGQVAQAGRGSLRPTPKSFMKNIVETFDLKKNASTSDAKSKLARAGYRGQSAEYTFLFFRFVMPILLFCITAFYIFVLIQPNWSLGAKVGACIVAALLGFKAPEVFLTNQAGKRAKSMQRVYPDALDLMLICVESGMSIEQGFRRVSVEIAGQSVALAEEFALLTAELSYLPDRRTAYENLVQRTGMESVKAISTALIQAEKYGTPVGTALRTLAQESRDNRMALAEKKAAALPPKLTVPMVIFFLPVLFAVIMTPALVQVFGWK